MKKGIKYLFLLTAAVLSGACQDFSDDTAFTPETPQLSFVEESIQADKRTQEYDLTIHSNLPWRIECDKEWVSFDPINGQGDATVKVTVAANRTLEERTATISAYVIKGDYVTLPVRQDPSSASDLVTNYYVKVDGSAENDGLSWEKATTLPEAIDRAMNGDLIHVAAGSYVPTVPLTGMKTDLDKTFELHSNFSLIGGYPADATTGAVADPEANETILDGNKSVCHVVAVSAAKMDNMKVTINGFTIRNATSQFSTVGYTSINGVRFYQSYGAALYIGNARVDVLNCKIKDNVDVRFGSIRVDAGSEVLFENCVAENNVSLDNCGCLWADGSQLLRINNCSFMNNKAKGVCSCIYIYGDTGGKTNVLITNTTIMGNSISPEHKTRNGGGIYVRENGNLVIVNSTIYGNHSGRGGGIAVYGKADRPSKAVIVSCTIAGNTIVSAGGGGIQQVNGDGAVEVYNSLVVGNTQGEVADDVAWSTKNHKAVNTVIGGTVYDAEGTAVPNAKFDFKTMLSPLGDNGGTTKCCVLLGDANPAREHGMKDSELEVLGATLNPRVEGAVSTTDQLGASRVGKQVIGAVVK